MTNHFLSNLDSSSYKLEIFMYKTSVSFRTKVLPTFPPKTRDPIISKPYNPQIERRFMKSTFYDQLFSQLQGMKTTHLDYINYDLRDTM